MNTHIALGTMLVALLAVGLAPAASAGPLFVEADVFGAHAEYENNNVQCQNAPFMTSPALRARAWSSGNCDFHVNYR